MTQRCFFLGLDTPHSEVHFYMMHIAYAAGGWALPVRASTSPSPTWTRKLPHVEEKVSCRSFDDMQNKMSLQLLFVKYICIFIQYIYMYCIKVYIMFDEILSRNKKCPEIYSFLIERRCVLHQNNGGISNFPQPLKCPEGKSNEYWVDNVNPSLLMIGEAVKKTL